MSAYGVLTAGNLCGLRMCGRACKLHREDGTIMIELEALSPNQEGHGVDLQGFRNEGLSEEINNNMWTYIQNGQISCQTCRMPARGYLNLERAIEAGVAEKKMAADANSKEGIILRIAVDRAQQAGITVEQAILQGAHDPHLLQYTDLLQRAREVDAELARQSPASGPEPDHYDDHQDYVLDASPAPDPYPDTRDDLDDLDSPFNGLSQFQI